MFMHICLRLDNNVISWEANDPSEFVTQSFFGFWATIRMLIVILCFNLSRSFS